EDVASPVIQQMISDVQNIEVVGVRPKAPGTELRITGRREARIPALVCVTEVRYAPNAELRAEVLREWDVEDRVRMRNPEEQLVVEDRRKGGIEVSDAFVRRQPDGLGLAAVGGFRQVAWLKDIVRAAAIASEEALRRGEVMIGAGIDFIGVIEVTRRKEVV